MNTEIWVEINGERRLLDTFENEVISLNYNLADIQDISSRNSSYSKTIVLPDTKSNRMAFEYISELTADSLFNQNLKSPCFIYSNGLLVFRGNLQLKNIKTDYVNGENTFEIVVFGESDTFIRAIGEKYLSDIDWSYLDHNWTYANILNSWNTGYNNGYFYPLMDNGKNYTEISIGSYLGNAINPSTGVYVDDMKPAFYAKTILDAIFLDSGFTYRSNFFNSDFFKTLIIPHNGQELLQGEDIYDNLFRVEFLPGSPTYSFLATQPYAYRLNFSSLLFNPNGNFQASPTYSYVQPDEVFVQAFGSEIIINFLVGATVSGTYPTNEITGSGGNFNTKLFDCDIYVKFRRDSLIGANSNIPVDGGPYYLNNSSYQGTLICQTKWVGPDSNGIIYPSFTQVRPGSFYEFFQVGNKVYGSFSCFIQTDELDNRTNPSQITKYQVLDTGEKVDLLIQMEYNVGSGSGANSGLQLGLFPLSGGEILVNSETSFYNIINSKLIPGGIINMNTNISKKFKQKDFIKGLITMFNLYIEPDKDNNRILNIEPREEYFQGGEILDWTDKIDLSSINTSFVSDFQSKKTTLTYKNDGDYLNKSYTEQTEEIYGQEISEFDNDFITDENKIETSFSPTPIIALPTGQGYGTFPMSRIAKDVNGGVFESNLRILQKNYISLSPSTSKNFWVLWSTLPEGGAANVQYSLPWAGHLDNPFVPTKDLNFGQVYTSSFNWDPTLNTLTYNYWQTYLDLINDTNSRYLEADFYLDETDIANFSFRNIIYLELNGQPAKFIVNKISNYNPSDKSLSKVELIKIR